MSAMSTKPQSLLQTRKPGALSGLASAGQTRLASLPRPVRLGSGLLPIALLVLLAGCATPSAPPTEAAKNPQPPRLSEPLPSESYLHKAQTLIESWRKHVTGM